MRLLCLFLKCLGLMPDLSEPKLLTQFFMLAYTILFLVAFAAYFHF